MLGSGSGGWTEDTGGSNISWFGLGILGSKTGGGISFFKTVLFSCFCTSGFSM